MRKLFPLLALLFGLAVPAAAHPVATPFPKVVQAGVPVGGLRSTDPDGMVVYRFDVPAGTTRINVITSAGTGSLQLYLRPGAHPGFNGVDATQVSRYPGTKHRIQVDQPQSGVWYVALQGVHGGYGGVKLQVQTLMPKGSLVPPAVLPAAGIYPENVRVQLKTRNKRTTVRYTLDGSEPGPTSPVATVPFVLTTDTTVKARVYAADGTAGPVAETFYQVRPAGDLIDIGNLGMVHHLASAKGGRHLFRVTTGAGEKLVITVEGGGGKSSVAVKKDLVPPLGKPKRGDTSFVRGAAGVIIPETEAGDYIVAIDAGTAFSGRSIMARIAGDGPDLLPWAPMLQPYVSNESFQENSCEVLEGMIGAGERRLLRYTTQVRNVGSKDLVMPPPEDNPFFEYHDCHGHWHFKGFASSRLLDLEGREVRSGHKVSFCLLDNLRWDRTAVARPRYNCSFQGIQAGWGDVYDSGLPGQWIELGDLPGGNYQLEITVNPDGILPEANYDNNVIRIPVTIPAPIVR